MTKFRTVLAFVFIAVAYGIAGRLDHDDAMRVAEATAPAPVLLECRDAEAAQRHEPSIASPKPLLTVASTERTALICVVVER